MISTLKLPFIFDAQKLKDDAAKIADDEWIPHFNAQYYKGDWSGIAFRAARNSLTALYPDPIAKDGYEDTENLARCPYIREVLEFFECELESARFLKLGAGATIREHRDYKMSFEDGAARIHIPVVTSPQVEFFLDKNPVKMEEGEVWYLNLNLPHSVNNRGSDIRIHLVIDCIPNAWLSEFFTAAEIQI